MKAKKVKASITLEKEILERARIESEKCSRSLSQFVNVILKHYLQTRDRKNLFTDED